MALTRSEQMSRIRGADTKPEVALREALAALGVDHDPDAKAPVGHPDLVFAAACLAVFIDGCFWHGCPLHYARPRTREGFWSTKLAGNVERDARQSRALTDAGWRVLRLWEHEVVEDVHEAAERVVQAIHRAPAPPWHAQRRVRRVVEVADRMERRDVVLLGDPTVVLDATVGPRITAKARTKWNR